MEIAPDADGRVDGTTYPRAVAPDDSVPLGEQPESLRRRILDRLTRRFFGAVIRVLRIRPGDVVVVRTDGVVPMSDVARWGKELRAAGHDGVAIVVPRDCLVHAEPGKLAKEDRGYRETKTYGTDANQDARGVHTGLPGLVKPHPESECE